MNMGNNSRNCLANCMTKEQERAYYETVLQKIYCNPRPYLDNLEQLWVFRVSFEDYHDKRKAKPKIRNITKVTIKRIHL